MSVSKEVPISKVEYQGMSLSQVNPNHLFPAIIIPDNIKNIEKHLVSITPALVSQSLNSDIFKTLEHLQASPNLILSLTQHLKCACGEISSILLKCSHPVCSTCAKLQYCSHCSHPISPYQQKIETYPCLSCKVRKPLRTNCVHYCLNCIVYKLGIKNSFDCFVCCESFDKTAFFHLQSICSICKIKGPFCFELSCGHFFCKDCLIKPSKNKSCPLCQTKMQPSEAYKLKKHFKYRCHLCFTFKSQLKFSVTSCCSTKICLSCSEKPLIHLCCYPLN